MRFFGDVEAQDDGGATDEDPGERKSITVPIGT
jgi:hypothetical protein